MIPLYHEPRFTFRFADDRIITRFHLKGVEIGQRVSVFKINPGTGERLGFLATATVAGDEEGVLPRAYLPCDALSRQPF